MNNIFGPFLAWFFGVVGQEAKAELQRKKARERKRAKAKAALAKAKAAKKRAEENEAKRLAAWDELMKLQQENAAYRAATYDAKEILGEEAGKPREIETLYGDEEID